MNFPDTTMGGPSGRFPTTAWTEILATGERALSEDQVRLYLDQLLREYWKPIYACLRAFWGKSQDEAKDLTQEFFLKLLSQDVLAKADPARGTFRSYLKGCLRNFVNELKRRGDAVKRGGTMHHVSLTASDGELTELESQSKAGSSDETFDRAWALSLIQETLPMVARALAAEGREREWECFRLYELAQGQPQPTHDELASRLGLPVRDVKTSLQNVRRRVRQAVRERILQYCPTPEEAEQELAALFPRA